MNVRDAIADDYEPYARLFRELGVDEGVPTPERFATDLSTRMLVGTEGADVVGYLLYELLDGVGYVRNVVSDPSRRRSGIGRRLMDSARARFADRGATAWCLNVKADNRAAIALYEKVGMGLHYRTTALRIASTTSLPPPDPASVLVRVPPETDAIVEPTFHLLRGQLASARKKPGREVVQLARGDDVLGVGVFMPVIPGAFPFRVTNRDDAATFLGLLRERTPDEARWLQVGVEDDAALAAHVQALGAYVHLELLHMHGSLA
jgi:GNAT superfamily N-acetyltransferase